MGHAEQLFVHTECLDDRVQSLIINIDGSIVSLVVLVMVLFHNLRRRSNVRSDILQILGSFTCLTRVGHFFLLFVVGLAPLKGNGRSLWLWHRHIHTQQ